MKISIKEQKKFIMIFKSNDSKAKEKIYNQLSQKVIGNLIINSVPVHEINNVLLKCFLMNDDIKAVSGKTPFKKIAKKQRKNCTLCGSNENLQIHHIKPKRNYPELKYKISNTMIVCKNCHDILHNRTKKKFYDIKKYPHFSEIKNFETYHDKNY